MATDKQLLAQLAMIRAIADTVIELVTACDSPFGCPGGHLYASLMQYLSLDQFDGLMSGLVAAGKLRKSGQCYFLAV
jgi:hypothetical protein